MISSTSMAFILTVKKPWPNGVASQRKLGNVNLRTQTWVGWPNGLASRRKFNASSKKAISVQPCTRTRTKENSTEANLRRRALGGQTVKNLRSHACKFELYQSGRKSSHGIASPRKPWRNGVAGYHKFSTCHNLRLHLARAFSSPRKVLTIFNID